MKTKPKYAPVAILKKAPKEPIKVIIRAELEKFMQLEAKSVTGLRNPDALFPVFFEHLKHSIPLITDEDSETVNRNLPFNRFVLSELTVKH